MPQHGLSQVLGPMLDFLSRGNKLALGTLAAELFTSLGLLSNALGIFAGADGDSYGGKRRAILWRQYALHAFDGCS